MDQIKPSTLVYGSNIISHYLRYCLVPTGFVYKFDPGPPARPKPLPILVVLLCFAPPLIYIVSMQVLMIVIIPSAGYESEEYKAIFASIFIWRLSKVIRVFRLILIIAVVAITLTQHGCISNVIASGNNYLMEKEQTRYAKFAFVFTYLNVLANTVAFPTVYMFLSNDLSHSIHFYLALIALTLVIFWTRLFDSTPLMFSCYLSASLGKHVENFSAIYIDTMFDQFMRAIEKEGDDSAPAGLTATSRMHPLPFFDDSSADGDGGSSSMANSGTTETTKHHQQGASGGGGGGKLGLDSHHHSFGVIRMCWHFLAGLLGCIYNLIRAIVIRLSMRRYPELPEMKMTKLSSTTKIQISERTRVANNHLIRVRLRRTQIMLSDLRDLVNDINRTSSPILMMYLAYETMFIILITTASVQAKVYKSISILILPTISVTISLVSCVVYVCVCYDETTKQLRLLINKLFDFIIMNHRVQSSGRPVDSRLQISSDDEQVCVLPGSEVGAINETWSQFQYTRKLANTIQFTMGGIMPVTRRLVLSIFGHILSAVFISIEIMSIIDTMNTPHNGNPAVRQNSTSTATQYNLTDISHNHHFHHQQYSHQTVFHGYETTRLK